MRRIDHGEIMTTREMLHVIVDKLPETELVTDARILIALDRPSDALQLALSSAPLDDERDDDDFDGGLTKSRSSETVSHEELLRRLGIE
jgi:hypothetical protein